MKAVLVSLRPHQWTKNLVLFAALAFSKHLFEPGPLLRALLAFALFCGLSGAVYLAQRRGRPRARPHASAEAAAAGRQRRAVAADRRGPRRGLGARLPGAVLRAGRPASRPARSCTWP